MPRRGELVGSIDISRLPEAEKQVLLTAMKPDPKAAFQFMLCFRGGFETSSLNRADAAQTSTPITWKNKITNIVNGTGCRLAHVACQWMFTLDDDPIDVALMKAFARAWHEETAASGRKSITWADSVC